ncbi:MAG: FAD-binding and (Fe-S)-binding domain-containing protein [Actinomycetales bacterium]
MSSLFADLRRQGIEVDASTRRRAEYSSDASLYRVVPQLVAFPRHRDEIVACLGAARQHRAALTMRGAGTSIAGNAVGPGIVLDTSRYLNQVLEIDPDGRRARVQPGAVMATVQRQAAPHGLRFGPDPSTWTRATIGGMIGNNACGPHAVAYGKTAQNVRSLHVVDGQGREFTAAAGDPTFSPVQGLPDLVSANLATLRTELGRFGRQVSGYSLQHLLPENDSHLARALVGTEGTCVLVLEAEIDLVPVPNAPTLVVLGYPDMATAADAVPALLRHSPLAIEGLDARLVDLVRAHRGAANVPALPAGAGWLMVEVSGENPSAAEDAARALAGDAGTSAVEVLPAGAQAAALWRIREDGAGLGGRTPSGAQGWPGWEDAAVPPERLGDYLRDFDALLAAHHLDGIPYGHFGDGCVHIRIDFPLADGASGVRVMQDFLTEAADLVASHGGSLSGEHGDGRCRSELLPRMYSRQALDAFAGFKHLFDPDRILNPGVLVDPDPLSANVRRAGARKVTATSGFAFIHDRGNITDAVHRCTGVGKCRADLSSSGAFMCPSYLATRDEKDSTRGRARVLQDLTNGSLVADWNAPEVAQALDLCLSCKACASDCPTGIDMATYKSEALYRRYQGRPRPVRHLTLGQLPRWARLAGPVAPAINLAMRLTPLRRVVLKASGLDSRRSIPRFATEPFRRWRRRNTPDPSAAIRGEVLLFVDSFSDSFAPEGARAAIDVLNDAGYRVRLPAEGICCGLTWISTGQLDGAKARLRRLVAALEPAVVAGLPIVGIEPSCTATLLTDLPDLLADHSGARRVAEGTRTLGQQLQRAMQDGWRPPDLTGVSLLAQPHCHQHSAVGYDADLAVLRAAGAQVRTVAGCCGLAGNFGMEAGHYEVSVAVARNGFLGELDDCPEDTLLLADGFSCRTQAADLAGVAAVTLAELLAGKLGR